MTNDTALVHLPAPKGDRAVEGSPLALSLMLSPSNERQTLSALGMRARSLGGQNSCLQTGTSLQLTFALWALFLGLVADAPVTDVVPFREKMSASAFPKRPINGHLAADGAKGLFVLNA